MKPDKAYIASLLIMITMTLFGCETDFDISKECLGFDMECCEETHRLGMGFPNRVRSSEWITTYQNCLIIKAIKKGSNK
jgi:hypothetical protein